MRIHTETTGYGSDIVLLHGWGCDLRSMQPISDILSKDYRVTNVDLPGRGQSDWNPNAQDIHDIADSLLPHLPEKAIYIAWSFGGLLTFSIASRYSHRVSRIIGIGTCPKFIETDNWPGLPKPGFQASIPHMQEIGPARFWLQWLDEEFSTFSPKPVAYEKALELLSTPEKNLDALLAGIFICDETDLRAEFSRIHCPIDLIFGEKDPCISILLRAEIQKLKPECRMHLIDDAQHMMFWTHPKQFKAILLNVMEKN